ncbi:MAG: hypothetical protein JST68_04080 [Bacteroidetes bacterium]|nr:hypothetical protein [Bacteroidota bacterium]
MIELKKIDTILDFIAEAIYKQVESGIQTSDIPPHFEACSCGQLIVPRSRQRGIHGTSAAIKVLGASENGRYSNVITGLLNYLVCRKEIDRHDSELSHTNNFQNDDKNIIKIAEQLHSLYFVDGLVADTSKLMDRLQVSLLDCYRVRNYDGWAFFMDDGQKERDFLPTCFAVMAISINGGCNKIENAIEILAKELLRYYDEKNTLPDPASFSIIVFMLYVVSLKVKAKAREKHISENQLKRILNKLWHSEFCVLDSHIEQDVEYWNEHDESFNVRIPWQLYLIALSAHLDGKKFSDPRIQKLLEGIYCSVKEKQQFKYGYSGKYMSTRTLSILYESLTIVKDNYKPNILYSGYYMSGVIFDKLSMKWVRLVSLGIFILAVFYIWHSYTKEPNKIFDDVATAVLVSTGSLLLVGIFRKK